MLQLKRPGVLIVISLAIIGCSSGSYFKSGTIESGPTKTSQVDFRFVKDLIIIPATVNGVAGNFVLDNGASISVFNPDFAKLAKLAFKDSSLVTDANTRSRWVPRAIVNTINIGNFQFLNTWMYKVDLSPLFPCDSIDGIIGANIINRAVWQINPQEKLLRLTTRPGNKEGVSIPLNIVQNNSAYVTIKVFDKDFRTKIDFGSRWGLKIKRGLLKEKNVMGDYRFIEGATSQSAFGLGLTDTVKQYLRPVKIGIGKKQTGNEAILQAVGNIKSEAYLGMGFLKNYVFTFNGPGKRLVLHNQQKRIKFINKGYGVRIFNDDGVIIVTAKEIGYAQVSPFKLGDKILMIDGVDVAEYRDRCEWEQYYAKKVAEKSPLKLHIEGVSRPITLSYRSEVEEVD